MQTRDGSWASARPGAHKHSHKVQLYGSLTFPANNSSCLACPPKTGTERLPRTLREPPSLSGNLQFQALLTTPLAQQSTSYHSGSQARNALACKAAAPAPQTSVSGPPLFLVSSWQRCADCVPGWEKASGEGRIPTSIGPPGGRRAQHRKSLPHAHIGGRHFVSVCLPRRGAAIWGHSVTHVFPRPPRLPESSFCNVAVFSGLPLNGCPLPSRTSGRALT